ncbi:MAG: hypothetical protein GXO83_12115 [Chlorobi bacterium]|nr:hypothetical protein [Chlorobiota bacterium]
MEWTLFWVIFLFLSGLGLIVQGVFGIKGSAGRWMLAMFLILLGLKLLIQHLPASDRPVHILERFPEDTLMLRTFSGDEIDVIFNSKVLIVAPSLTDTTYGTLDISTVFGTTRLVIPDSLNVEILVDAVFSACKLPDGSTVHFGSANFSHGKTSDTEPLRIRADVIFGTMDVMLVR